MEFVLHKIKVHRRTQRTVFDQNEPPQEILRQMILERPTERDVYRVQWHIGNVESLDEVALYFRLGRTTKATLPTFNPGSRTFVDEEYNSAPYTHVFVDIQNEIAAIAVKSALAPTTDVMARQLQRLLSRSHTAEVLAVDVTVTALAEPEQLIQALNTAYAITSFTIHFTRPNPFDVNEDFLKPMEQMAEAAGGSNGFTTIRGLSLDAKPLEELVRSAAASGDNATARIRPQENSKTVSRTLRGQNARIAEEQVTTEEGRRNFISLLRDKYKQIRGSSSPPETT